MTEMFFARLQCISDDGMIYSLRIVFKKTYTLKVKRSIETENATPTAMESFVNKF